MNSFFAEYAADSRNSRRIALGGGDRGIKTVFGRIVERLRFASRRNGCFGGNFYADFHSQVCKSEAYSVSLDRSVSASRSFELINPPAINILAVFLRYFPAFEEGEAFRSCIPSAREIQEIAFGSKNSREAGGWIIQYAGRYGYNAETIDRFWRVYSMVANGDSY